MSEQSSPVPLRERNGTPALKQHEQEIRKHIRDLCSDDFAVRAESISELEKYGQPAAEAIVHTLLKKAPQPDALVSYSEALEEIGKPSVNVILHALSHIPEVRRPEEVYVLESLVETLGRLGDRRAAEPLAQQLEKLNRAIKRNHSRLLVDVCESAKVRILSILAELGSKAGLSDLLEMLGDGRRRVRAGIVQAVGQVGDRRALLPLIRLYAVEDDVSFAGAETIKDAFREIARRERIATDDAIFRGLNGERAILEKLLPKARGGK